MNLSFVCYDDEEEPMLYKQNRASELNTAKKEEDSSSQPWRTSNGFLIRDANPMVSIQSFKESNGDSGVNKSQHIISGRDFHNILQACRPRNRGEHGSGLPLSLSTLIRKSANESNRISTAHVDPSQRSYTAQQGPHPRKAGHESGQVSPQRMMNYVSRGKCLEWGAVNFEGFESKQIQDDAGSQSSHSSSFASCGSNAMALQQSGLGHIQSSISLDTMRRDCNMSPNNVIDISAIKKFMSEYDKRAFSHPAAKQHGRSKVACNSPLLPSSRIGGGIEAALQDYENPKRDEKSEISDPPELVKTGSIKDNSVIISERSLAVSPLGSLVIPYSFDSRRPQVRPGAVRLVVPEALPGSALKSNNLLGSRRKSFSVLHDSLREHVGSMNSKTPKHNLSKMPSQAATKKQSARGDRHTTQRRRRKNWVLNPFRQEDEDEVLAKRTHNRRRWSHVFPLGEEASRQ